MLGSEDDLDPQNKPLDGLARRGPAGEVQPKADNLDPRSDGGQSREDVENRPSVGTVKSEDYPAADRAESKA